MTHHSVVTPRPPATAAAWAQTNNVVLSQISAPTGAEQTRLDSHLVDAALIPRKMHAGCRAVLVVAGRCAQHRPAPASSKHHRAGAVMPRTDRHVRLKKEPRDGS